MRFEGFEGGRPLALVVHVGGVRLTEVILRGEGEEAFERVRAKVRSGLGVAQLNGVVGGRASALEVYVGVRESNPRAQGGVGVTRRDGSHRALELLDTCLRLVNGRGTRLPVSPEVLRVEFVPVSAALVA